LIPVGGALNVLIVLENRNTECSFYCDAIFRADRTR